MLHIHTVLTQRHFLCQYQSIQMKDDDLAEAHIPLKISYIYNSCDSHMHAYKHTLTEKNVSFSLLYEHYLIYFPLH